MHSVLSVDDLAASVALVLMTGPLADTIAGYLAIFVLFFVPALLIYLFWMIHIIPEKIAERRHHPQAEAIKVLCLMSLVFGGLLWPFALLWAYSKPVLYKMAYGAEGAAPPPAAAQPAPPPRAVPDLAAVEAVPGEH